VRRDPARAWHGRDRWLAWPARADGVSLDNLRQPLLARHPHLHHPQDRVSPGTGHARRAPDRSPWKEPNRP